MALCDSHSGSHWLSLPLSGILWPSLAHYCSLISHSHRRCHNDALYPVLFRTTSIQRESTFQGHFPWTWIFLLQFRGWTRTEGSNWVFFHSRCFNVFLCESVCKETQEPLFELLTLLNSFTCKWNATNEGWAIAPKTMVCQRRWISKILCLISKYWWIEDEASRLSQFCLFP